MTLPNESRQACLDAVCSTNYGLDKQSFQMRSWFSNPAFLGKHISMHCQENQQSVTIADRNVHNQLERLEVEEIHHKDSFSFLE